MDLTSPFAALPDIDLYCERVTNHWLDEPLGLTSNAAFLIAAWYCARHGTQVRSLGSRWLIALLAAIGVGSGLFHATATQWALLLDVIPIQLFILSALWILLRSLLGLSFVMTALALMGFMAMSMWIPGHWLNGSAGYIPAWLALVLVTWQSPRGAARHWLGRASLLFPISLLFRTLDQPFCEMIPFGTHFIWHLCNAVVLAMIIEASKLAARDLADTASKEFFYPQNLHNIPSESTRKDR